jgi:hypothetical protein
MNGQKNDKQDPNLISPQDQELSDEQLEEVVGGTSNNTSAPKRKAGEGQKDFLVVTIKDVLISS